MVVSIVFVNKVMETSKEKSLEITKSNILKSASQYTKEFKLENTDYWFDEEIEVEEEIVEIEYACTTVGMLINKGFLKSNVLGLELLDGTIIDKTTSVKVSRDKNTKVFTDETIFNDSACSETGDINLTFSVEGVSNLGYENWYNKDVTIIVVANNVSAIADSSVIVKVGDTPINSPEVTENNKKQSNWSLLVGTQGQNIDVCINVKDYKDSEKEFCLADNQKYNMDKEPPTNPTLSLIKSGNYQLISSGSADNISSNLTYYLSKNENTSINSATYNISTNERQSEEEVITYTIDQAGNKSEEVTKLLSITNSDTVSATTLEKYYCSFDADTIYQTEAEAIKKCNYDVTDSQSYFVCSLDQNQYQNDTEARNNCIDEETGTVSTYYYCGDTLSTTTTCTGDTQSEGFYRLYYYECRRSKWYYSYNQETDTDCAGFGDDYTKTKTSCNNSCPTQINNSCTNGSIKNYCSLSCTNTCSQVYTAETKYYCSVTEDYVDSLTSTCIKTTSGAVTEVPQYYCEYTKQIYTDYNEAVNDCTGETSSDIKYYCSLTDSIYDTNSEATKACTNYCNNGDYYSNACYSLH